jgi:hypothetical protein
MKKLTSIFPFKKNKTKAEAWSKTLTQIIELEGTRDLELPILLVNNEIEWEFEVFQNLQSLINTSIYSHWNGIAPTDSKLNAFIIDCKGKIYTIDTNCYSKELKIGYSYPKETLGEMDISSLKKRVIKACKEYIEVFNPEFKDNIITGMNLINNSQSIKEIIHLIDYELNFDTLKKSGLTR